MDILYSNNVTAFYIDFRKYIIWLMYMRFNIFYYLFLISIIIILLLVGDFDFLYSQEGITTIQSIQRAINNNQSQIITANEEASNIFS